MLTVFAFTRHAADVLGRPASIIFDALENAPAEQITIDGDTYTRNVGDLIDSGQLDRAERTAGSSGSSHGRATGRASRTSSAPTPPTKGCVLSANACT